MGLEIGTTLVKRNEETRLQKLKGLNHFSQPKYDQALVIDPATCLRFFEDACKPFGPVFPTFSKTPVNGDEDYYRENNWFSSVDAEVLYSFVRSYRPKQVVEIGSGFSTRLTLRAIADGKLQTKVLSIDPAPRVPFGSNVSEHIQAKVEDVDLQTIASRLKAGDLLFIDSSHQIITGGDIPYLFLEVLPRLAKGVFIHIHDIFLPFDYPEEALLDRRNWAEQYLVHAFLAYNNSFQILWLARYMWEYHRCEILKLIPADGLVLPPSSLWIQKVA